MDRSFLDDKKALFSTLWVFLMFNYLYADVMGLMDSTLLRQYLTGAVNGMTVDGQMLFAAAILMELPIAMIVLSRICSDRVVRVLNIVAGSIKALVVFATLFVGHPQSYYVFFAAIEVVVAAGIVVTAARWRVSRR